jgi:hypothetical protein
MLKPITFCSLLLLLGFAASLWSEDFPFTRTRPLMALCVELQDRYGLLVTYEDAPTDPVTETSSEVHPNGITVFFPKWKPVTFHVPTSLPMRPDATAPLSGAVDPDQSLDAVREVVDEYNESGNPGRFVVVVDGQYLHIQQVARMVSGNLQSVEPVSNTVVTWQSRSGTCQQILDDLYADLRQQHGLGIAEGNIPVGALLTHHCEVDGSSLTVRQILEAVLNGLDTNNVTGQETLSYAWDLVYDPNWNKYFLSFSLVSRHGPPAKGEAASPNSTVAKPASRQVPTRLGAPSTAKPRN